MNLAIDPNKLLSLLTNVPACNPEEVVPFSGAVHPYLFEHFLMPFLQDAPPTLGALNFSKFSSEDLDEFESYLEAANQTSIQLAQFCGMFAAYPPAAASKQSFC